MADTPALRDYQVADLCFYMQNPRCANLSDPGTGKTPSVCVYLYWLWVEQRVRSFWVMPKSLLDKNYRELLRFSHFAEDDVAVIDGPPERLNRLLHPEPARRGSRLKRLPPDPKVLLLGFDRFARDWPRLRTRFPDLGAVAVDEIHMGFGSDGSARTQALYAALRQMTYFLAMTGTLIDGRLDSAYPTIHIIEPRYYPSHTAFLAEHAILDLDTGRPVAWRGHAKLAAILGRHAIRRSFQDVYGPEAKVVQVERVPMAPRQRAAYDEFAETALLELESFFLDGTEPGVATIRCRQIMAHPERLPNPTGGPPVDLMQGEPTGKDERLAIHLTDHANTGKPVLIYTALVPEQERLVGLCRRAGLRAGLINGTVGAARRARLDEDFRAGRLDALVASQATAAVGYNWEHVDHVIYASLDYKDTNFVQAYRRAIRGVRRTPLRITILEYEDSVDQRVFEILERKSDDAHQVDATREKLQFREPSPAPSPSPPPAGPQRITRRTFQSGY